MAKTRIKTTPTRMQKEALMASEVVSTTTNIVTEHVLKKRISVLKSSLAAKEKSLPPVPSTIIVQPPKRTNSISSTISTISQASDETHSCTDSPPPSNISEAGVQNNGPTMDELTASAIKTLNAGFLAKSNARLLKNRKVYMITEKCDDAANAMHNSENANGAADTGTTTGQKRKMFLIMEEDENEKNNEKQMKVESFAPKKLTLYTNTSDGQLPQEFEKVLPDILNRIQSNKGVKKIVEAFKANGEIIEATEPKAAQISLLKTNNNSKFQLKTETSERLPLTLPPKKNRTKIITTQIIPVNPSQPLAVYPANGIENSAALNTTGTATSGLAAPGLVTLNTSNGFYKTEKSCAATPVIVNASTLLATNGNASIPTNGLKSKENCNSNKPAANQLHKNINLSTDFLFLMKMLPKLESIEEPHKNYVKAYIEDIINQYAPHQIEQQ